ncbi:hypothetical protein Hdeb2414_s0020g00566621 [Helianthus debilis subsp. tardiflorus]
MHNKNKNPYQILSFFAFDPSPSSTPFLLLKNPPESDSLTDFSTSSLHFSESFLYFSTYFSAPSPPPAFLTFLAFFLRNSSATFSSFLSFSSANHSSIFFSAFTCLSLRPLISRHASKLFVFFWPAFVAAPRSNDPNPPLPPRRRNRRCTVEFEESSWWNEESSVRVLPLEMRSWWCGGMEVRVWILDLIMEIGMIGVWKFRVCDLPFNSFAIT